MTESMPPAPKPRRWLMPVLLVSVALNLLVVGVIAGSWLSPDGPRRGGDDRRAVRGVLGEPFFRALPDEHRRELVSEIRQRGETFRDGREALRQRVANFLGALRAESFDRAEVKRLMDEQRRVATDRQDFGEALLLDRLEAMTSGERTSYADALEARLKGLKRR